MAADGSFSVVASQTEAQDALVNFWPKILEELRTLGNNDFKTHELPLARIKKIMKLDDDVKMISAEAPVLFAKAAEIFIRELSIRAWIHTEESKRRTLQKNDIALAVSKYDQYDFLIDIVPRDEIKPTKRSEDSSTRTGVGPEQVQYYLQMQQQPQAQAAAPQQTIIQLPGGQMLQQPLQLQLSGGGTVIIPPTAQTQMETTPPQVIQIQAPVTQTQPQQHTTQVFQQMLTPSGEVKNVPIQLTPSQLQAITLQLQGAQPGQPIIIQTSALQQQARQASQSTMMNLGGQVVYVQPSDDQNTDGDS